MKDFDLSELPKAGIDFDDTLADTAPILAEYIKANSPIRYPVEKLMSGRITRDQDQLLYSMRQQFLRDPARFSYTPALPGVKLAVPICNKFLELQLLTGTVKTLADPLKEWFDQQNITDYFTKFHLRDSRDESHGQHKWDRVRDEGFEVVVDDDGEFCKTCAERGVFAILMDRPSWNRRVVEGPNLKRYPQLLDLAFDLTRHGSLGKLIRAHQETIQLPPSSDPDSLFDPMNIGS